MSSIKTALIVDDSRSARAMTSAFLGSLCPDWTIVQASDGEDALDNVTVDPPGTASLWFRGLHA